MFSLGISCILKKNYVGISILIPKVLFFLLQNFMFRWYSKKFVKDQWKKEECLSVCSNYLISMWYDAYLKNVDWLVCDCEIWSSVNLITLVFPWIFLATKQCSVPLFFIGSNTEVVTVNNSAIRKPNSSILIGNIFWFRYNIGYQWHKKK